MSNHDDRRNPKPSGNPPPPAPLEPVGRPLPRVPVEKGLDYSDVKALFEQLKPPPSGSGNKD